jgi:hypothetical protein
MALQWRTVFRAVPVFQVDMTKLVGVNLASSHTYQDSEGNYYSMGTSLLSGPKYHIIRTPAAASGKAQDGGYSQWSLFRGDTICYHMLHTKQRRNFPLKCKI